MLCSCNSILLSCIYITVSPSRMGYGVIVRLCDACLAESAVEFLDTRPSPRLVLLCAHASRLCPNLCGMLLMSITEPVCMKSFTYGYVAAGRPHSTKVCTTVFTAMLLAKDEIETPLLSVVRRKPRERRKQNIPRMRTLRHQRPTNVGHCKTTQPQDLQEAILHDNGSSVQG